MAENESVDQDCIFCRIVADESPCHRIWEDENHLAFLSIYPNTPGVTVVIPKAHRPSYVFDNDDATVCSLMKGMAWIICTPSSFPCMARVTGLLSDGSSRKGWTDFSSVMKVICHPMTPCAPMTMH